MQVGDDVRMIDPDEFEALRAQVCASGPASSGDNLLGMEIDVCAYLGILPTPKTTQACGTR